MICHMVHRKSHDTRTTSSQGTQKSHDMSNDTGYTQRRMMYQKTQGGIIKKPTIGGVGRLAWNRYPSLFWRGVTFQSVSKKHTIVLAFIAGCCI